MKIMQIVTGAKIQAARVAPLPLGAPRPSITMVTAMPAQPAGTGPARAVTLARLVDTNPQPAHPLAAHTAQLDDTRVRLGPHRVPGAAIIPCIQTGANTSQTRASPLVGTVLRDSMSTTGGQRLA